MEITTNSAEQTFKIGKKLGKILKSERVNVVCLYGQLGAGKTTFTQGLGSGFGLKNILPSPTFIIVRQYKIVGSSIQNFNHIDLYRLEKNENLEFLNFSEMFSVKTNFNVIEWADKLGRLLPKNRLDINFSVSNGDIRNIKFNFYGSAVKIITKVNEHTLTK